MGLLLGHSNGSMWNCYSFQPVGPWMDCPFTDLGAEGCCRSLNASLIYCLMICHNMPTLVRFWYTNMYFTWLNQHFNDFPWHYLEEYQRGSLNMQIPYYRYMNFHHKDKTVSQTSYLHNGNPVHNKNGLYIETGSWNIPCNLLENDNTTTTKILCNDAVSIFHVVHSISRPCSLPLNF